MGEPVKIRELAEQMIRFYGLVPEEDIKIEYVGLRAGERLNEKLVWDFEIPKATDFNRILKVSRNKPVKLDINAIKNKLKDICCFNPQESEKYRNNELLRSILREHISNYTEG